MAQFLEQVKLSEEEFGSLEDINYSNHKLEERFVDTQVRHRQTEHQQPKSTLDEMTNDTNENSKELANSKYFFNLSIGSIATNTSKTVNGIINDLFNIGSLNHSFIQIFIKEDRLIYIGILMVIITLLIILIRMADIGI